MPWNDAYWEILDYIYWEPRLVGLKSERSDDPSPPKGTMYRRSFKASELRPRGEREEVMLNHVFTLFAAIAPSALLERLFAISFGWTDVRSLRSLRQREHQRYGLSENENGTQHDGYLVGDNALIGVEFKLGASTSLRQVLKYAVLMAAEQALTGRREQLGLIYIVPEGRVARIAAQIGLAEGGFTPNARQSVAEATLNLPMRRLADMHAVVLADTLDRLHLRVISWSALAADLASARDELTDGGPGGEAIGNLIEGYLAQMRCHGGTGLG